MNAENSFSCSWDGLVRGVTVGVFVLVVVVTAVLGTVAGSLLLVVALTVLYGGIVLLPLLWAPIGYFVDDGRVTVERLIGDAQISVNEGPNRWSWAWWGIRLFGSGGFYGYYGYFAFKGLGRVRMYATNRHNLVLLRDTRGGKILLSPDEPERFIQRLELALLSVR